MATGKTITLNFTGYKIYDTVRVRLWGGETCTIEMTPFLIYSLDDETLKKGINDGGFGVEQILSADLRIFEDYQGYEMFYADKFISLVEEA